MTCVPRIAFNHALQIHGSKCAATRASSTTTAPRARHHTAKEHTDPQPAQLPYDKQPAFAVLQAQHRPTAPRPSSPSWSSSPPVRAGVGSAGSSPLPATDGRRQWSDGSGAEPQTRGNLGGRVHMCGAAEGYLGTCARGGEQTSFGIGARPTARSFS